MKYLEKSFSVGPPKKVSACERCVYGTGKHLEFCAKAVVFMPLKPIKNKNK